MVTIRPLDEFGLFGRFDRLPHSAAEKAQFDVGGSLAPSSTFVGSGVNSATRDAAEAGGSTSPDIRRPPPISSESDCCPSQRPARAPLNSHLRTALLARFFSASAGVGAVLICG